MKLTVKVKLLPTPDQKLSLLKTIEAFNEACDYISGIAFKNKTFGQVGIHHLCYREVREKFKLSAQFTVRAIGKVSESYRVKRGTEHTFGKHSAIVYDDRLLSFRNLSIASILTMDGRRKIPVVFGSYAKLEQRRIARQADLQYTKGKFYLCLVIEFPDDTPITPKDVMGVDLGIVNIATTSDGQSFSGEQVDKVRIRTTALKSRLQSCGTKSAKRHLKKLSGRERRFKKNINHTISKALVKIAQDTQRAIALEDLKGFRVTVRRDQRERFGKWSFDELGRFVAYKAQMAGIPAFYVDPRHTSQTCSRCGHVARSNRKSQSSFVCGQCGFSLNADWNAALNIAQRARVNVPTVAYPNPQICCSSPELQALSLQGEGS